MNEYRIEQFDKVSQELKKDDLEGKVLDFDDPDSDKSTPVCINKINSYLGSGDCSLWVVSANIGVAKDSEDRKHTRDVAIKKFRDPSGKDSHEIVEKKLLKNYKNYKVFKAMGLPTFDTYRINKEYGLAMMTLRTNEGRVLLTSNDFASKEESPFLENPVKTIANLDDFVLKVKEVLERNVKNGFCPSAASYGIVFKPKNGDPGSYDLDIMFVDFGHDNLSFDFPYKHDQYFQDKMEEDNIREIEMALRAIFPGDNEEKRAFRKMIIDKIK